MIACLSALAPFPCPQSTSPVLFEFWFEFRRTVGGSVGFEFSSPLTCTVIVKLWRVPAISEFAKLPFWSATWTSLRSPEFVPSSSSVAPNPCCATSKLPSHPCPLLQSFGFGLFGTGIVPYFCLQSISIGFGPDSPWIGTFAVQYSPPVSLAATAGTLLIVMKAFWPGFLVF